MCVGSILKSYISGIAPARKQGKMARSTLLLFFFVSALQGLIRASDFDEPLVRSLSSSELRMAEEVGFSYVDRITQMEEELYAQGVYVKEGSHMSRMAKFKQPSQEVIELGQKSMQLIETTRFLKNQLGLTNEEAAISLMSATTRAAINLVNNSCLPTPTCNYNSKYRTIDGSCNSNNAALANLGKSSTDYRRLAAPAYNDGVQDPRSKSTNGSALPGARLVSVVVFNNNDDKLYPTITLSLMQFGQFLNHDLQQTTQFTFSNGTGISCCTSDKKTLPANQLNPFCLPIPVPDDDRFFNRRLPSPPPPPPPPPLPSQTCMSFVRSSTGPRLDCSKLLGYADQLNSNTHWLDGSTIYGSDIPTMVSLRENAGTGYLLRMSTDSIGRKLLPTTTGCTNGPCFYAGDPRATEQPQLTVMHTLWAREHNRVAKALYTLNATVATWSNESLFQEARRIVIAELQHITYNEFIPNLIDQATYKAKGLAPQASGYMTGTYNNNLVSSGPVSNEFSTAAFRMGHSVVQGLVQLYAENGAQLPSYSMSDYFNNPSMIVNDPNFIDNVIRGLITQQSEQVDDLVTDALWNKLFRNPGEVFGFDIVALNIQRGRDHGLPSYNTYRQYCGYAKVTSFSQLSDPSFGPSMNPNVVTKLSQVYATVEDIDLYVGGLLELYRIPQPGRPKNQQDTGIGPTLTCLISENFASIKNSDRYFYERAGQPGSFNSGQLAEIKKASLARIYCDNSDQSIKYMIPYAFQAPDNGPNAKTLCSNTGTIPSLNLALWKNEPVPSAG